VSLRSALEPELEEVRASYPGAALTVDGTVPDVDVQGNEMLDSVFRNLLKNAVQHNDKPVAEVEVSATERDDAVTVRVADNGPGVPDRQKDDIFGKGEKGLESAGTGIGLYLVQTLVDDVGGEVWVEDNDPDGAVFAVELQRA
jgi:signal transduction histidine kinase